MEISGRGLSRDADILKDWIAKPPGRLDRRRFRWQLVDERVLVGDLSSLGLLLPTCLVLLGGNRSGMETIVVVIGMLASVLVGRVVAISSMLLQHLSISLRITVDALGSSQHHLLIFLGLFLGLLSLKLL